VIVIIGQQKILKKVACVYAMPCIGMARAGQGFGKGHKGSVSGLGSNLKGVLTE